MEPNRGLFRLDDSGMRITLKRTFNFAYCRPFSTLHRLPNLSYTEARSVILLTVYTELRRQTYTFLAARQEDSRY